MDLAQPLTREAIGYYTDAAQTEPVFDPGLCACPVCGAPLTEDDVRTVSMSPADPSEGQAPISAFYRLHRTCAVEGGDELQAALDAQAADLIDEIATDLAAAN